MANRQAVDTATRRETDPGWDVTSAPAPKPQQCARQGSKLPREVITWLQSLPRPNGASTSPGTGLRHPKRDLSNGARIADICACYWNDVPLHSLRNELSLEHKRANWRVLAKLFARHGAPLSDAMIDGMIEARDGQFAEVFLLQLYSLLTGKPLRAPLPVEDLALPPVAPPPAAPYRPPQVIGANSGSSGAHHRGGNDTAGETGTVGWWSFENRALAVEAAEGDIFPDSAADRARAQYPPDAVREPQPIGRMQQRQQQQQQSPSLPSLGLDKGMGSSAAARRTPPVARPSASTTATTPPPPPLQHPAGTDSAPAPLDEDGRVKVRFDVSVRAAKQASTVVRGAPKGKPKAGASVTTTSDAIFPEEGETAAGSNGADDLQGSLGALGRGLDNSLTAGITVDTSLCPEVARWAFKLLASAVRAATGEEDSGEDGDGGAEGTQGTQWVVRFFLLCRQQQQQQQQRQGSRRGREESSTNRVWELLNGQRDRLAAHARADSTALAQLVEVLLRVPLQLGVNARREHLSTSASNGQRSPSDVGVPPGAFRVFASVLAALAALDPYRATATLKAAVLYNTELMTLCVALHDDAAVVAGLAEMLLAVTRFAAPAAAAAQVKEVLTALEDALFASPAHPVEGATALFLLLLRACVVRSGEESGTERSAVPSPSPETSAPSLTASPSYATRQQQPQQASTPSTSGVVDCLLDVGRTHVLRALSKASSTPRARVTLAATWLATGVLRTASRHSTVTALALVQELSPFLLAPPTLSVVGVDAAEEARGSESRNQSEPNDMEALLYAVAFAVWSRTAVKACAVARGSRSATTGTDTSLSAAHTTEEGVLAATAWLAAAPAQPPQRDATLFDAATTMVASELALLLGDAAPSSLLPVHVCEQVAQAVVAHLVHRVPSHIAEALLAPLPTRPSTRGGSSSVPAATAAAASGATLTWDVPVLGRITVSAGFPGTSDPLVLSEALLRECPLPASDGATGSRKEWPPTTAAAATTVQRRIATAANALVREGGQMAAGAVTRLRWLYFINRSGLPTNAAMGPSTTSQRKLGGSVITASDRARTHEDLARWRLVSHGFYEDMTLAVAAAETLRARQQQRMAAASGKRGGGSADASPESEWTEAQSSLLLVAGMSQRVALAWFMTLSQLPVEQQQQQQQRDSAAPRQQSTTFLTPALPAEGAESAEQFAAAMEWFKGVILP